MLTRVTDNDSGVFIPPGSSLSSLPEYKMLHSGQGSLFSREQLRFLSERATKVWLALVNYGREEFACKLDDLGNILGIKMVRTTAATALEELRRNHLVQTQQVRDRNGHNAGLRIRVLLPPRNIPSEANLTAQEKLLHRRAKLIEKLADIDDDLNILELTTP